MPKTLAEKILSEKSGTDAKAGDIVIAKVDLAFVQDTTGPLTVRAFQSSGLSLSNPARTVLFIDHAAPSPNAALANGAQLYGSYCSGCHSNPPPNSWRTNRSAAQLTSAINSGPGSMPAYSSILTTAQVAAIVQFIQGTATPPATTPPPTIPPTTIPPLTDAAMIYTNSCANCHGANRTGGNGPNITPSALANRSVSNLINFISGHNTGRNLTSEQITTLVGWLKPP